MALLVQEENYPRVSGIRESLETLVFGKPYHELVLDGRVVDGDEEAIVLLKVFQVAMGSFKTLVAPENKQFKGRWAKEWLVDVGVEEHNPVKLFLFSMSWHEHYNAVLETINAVATEYKL